MEKSKFYEHLLEPKEMYKRMVELSVSLLWKWEQMILVRSYFEQVTLAELLDPFCDIGDITTLSFTESMPLCFNYLLCSLAYVNVTHTQTTETRSLTTYLSSICPKDNVSLQLELINQKECGKNRFQKLFKAILFGDEDADVEIIVPEVMQHFVVELMANSSNTIPFKINQENQVALTFNGAIDWFMSDFNMYLAGKEFSLDSISDQKIVYYLILHTQSEQYKLKVSHVRLYIFILFWLFLPIWVFLSVLQIILIIRTEYTTKTPEDKVNLLP